MVKSDLRDSVPDHSGKIRPITFTGINQTWLCRDITRPLAMTKAHVEILRAGNTFGGKLVSSPASTGGVINRTHPL